MTNPSDFAVRYAAAQREHERRTGKPTARKAKARKAAPQPTLKDYVASGLSALSSAANPQKTGMEVGQQIANAAPRVLGNIGDYIMGNSPMDVLRDVGRGAGAVGTYLSDPMNAASTALDFIPVIGDIKGLGQDLRSAAQLRASGDIAGARGYEQLAIPLAVAGIVPGIGEARTAARLAGEGADVARAAERAASDLSVPRPTRPALAGADSPYMVSTRRPTAPNYAAHGNPDEQLLVQSGEALRAAPAAFEKNMNMMAEEPFMTGAAGASPEAIYDTGLRRGADNLKFIMNELMDPETVQAARGWYPTANMVAERAATRAGLPAEAGYGVAAVTSPQTPWDINVARLDRMMDMYGDRFATDPAAARRYIEGRLETKSPGAIAMRGPDYAERIAAMPYEELSDKFDKFARVSLADATRNDPVVRRIDLSGGYGEPYGGMTWGSGDVISKALGIMDDPSMENINAQLLGGGKVPSFYNNIAEPFSEAPITTIDTHSAGAASLFPGGGNDPIVYRAMGLGGPKGGPPGAADVARTGSKGLYGPLSDMHTLAAQEMGFGTPREVQSATWEGVRDLWGQAGKTPALKAAIADIWRTSSTPDEARYRIAELLGKPVQRVFQVK